MYSASGNEVLLTPLVVSNFAFKNCDLRIDKIQLFVSQHIQGKSILGMDILSQLHFAHEFDKGNKVGSIWVYNLEERIEQWNSRKGFLDKNRDYFIPKDDILELDQVSSFADMMNIRM